MTILIASNFKANLCLVGVFIDIKQNLVYIIIMRILGIDPGYAIVGYGVIEKDKSGMNIRGVKNRFVVVRFGLRLFRKGMNIYMFNK